MSKDYYLKLRVHYNFNIRIWWCNLFLVTLVTSYYTYLNQDFKVINVLFPYTVLLMCCIFYIKYNKKQMYNTNKIIDILTEVDKIKKEHKECKEKFYSIFDDLSSKQ